MIRFSRMLGHVPSLHGKLCDVAILRTSTGPRVVVLPHRERSVKHGLGARIVLRAHCIHWRTSAIVRALCDALACVDGSPELGDLPYYAPAEAWGRERGACSKRCPCHGEQTPEPFEPPWRPDPLGSATRLRAAFSAESAPRSARGSNNRR